MKTKINESAKNQTNNQERRNTMKKLCVTLIAIVTLLGSLIISLPNSSALSFTCTYEPLDKSYFTGPMKIVFHNQMVTFIELIVTPILGAKSVDLSFQQVPYNANPMEGCTSASYYGLPLDFCIWSYNVGNYNKGSLTFVRMLTKLPGTGFIDDRNTIFVQQGLCEF